MRFKTILNTLHYFYLWHQLIGHDFFNALAIPKRLKHFVSKSPNITTSINNNSHKMINNNSHKWLDTKHYLSHYSCTLAPQWRSSVRTKWSNPGFYLLQAATLKHNWYFIWPKLRFKQFWKYYIIFIYKLN